jgi:hypothetical protein
VALVVAGVAVLTNAFKPASTAAFSALDGSSASPSASATSSASVSASHTPKPLPSPRTTAIRVSVFSGVTTLGCARTVNTMLVGDGYIAADPASDATHKPIAKTVVYYRQDPQGRNRSNATYMASHYFNDARVAKLSATFPGVVSPLAKAVVLIGTDYTSKC